MDTLRGSFGAYDSPLGAESQDDEAYDDAGNDSPPPGIGADERRMQVRAYNFWAALLEDRNFPHVEDLDPELLPDFGPHGVLLDFSKGIEDPAVTFLGAALAEECGAGGVAIAKLSDVPSRSLLSRITDHYMQIIANQAPIGFEAEFVNQRGNTIAYRGILLPFSSDDETIDFIFGVINWKELADARTTDELLLEIDQALDTTPPKVELADWADGPNVGSGFEAGLPVPSFGLDDDETLPSASLTPAPASAPVSLADWLAAAREQAFEARVRLCPRCCRSARRIRRNARGCRPCRAGPRADDPGGQAGVRGRLRQDAADRICHRPAPCPARGRAAGQAG
jgi:hypothetical protein